jgi:hypothetical protein
MLSCAVQAKSGIAALQSPIFLLTISRLRGLPLLERSPAEPKEGAAKHSFVHNEFDNGYHV